MALLLSGVECLRRGLPMGPPSEQRPEVKVRLQEMLSDSYQGEHF